MISFIVPAHNEARVIAATLEALHGAAGALGVRYEIVVVDDASTDATAGIAAHHHARVVRVEHRHIAAARNAGAGKATGDRFVFVDADTLIDPSVLHASLDAMQRGAVGGGAAVRLSGRLSLHERIVVSCAIWLFRATRIAPGCFVFCTRTAFEAVGGFDETYYAGEDVAISRALARHGRFVILRQAVQTSPRKLRTHSLAEHLRLLARFAWRGRRMLRSRRDLDLWYGKRRD
ncbi:MAG: glycosyltransferase [Pseudomonadota bacterium]|nr:glycosyltransferase [Pseudomonadota bacterium]